MKQRNPRSLIMAGSLIVAVLCTVMVEGGWLVWIPVLLAILVVSNLQHSLKV
jgi:hypothetical protein